MEVDMVKITLDVPKMLRVNIRIAAAEKDRTVSAEIRDTLMQRYMGSSDTQEMACSEA